MTTPTDPGRAAVTVAQEEGWVLVTIGEQRLRLAPSEAGRLSVDLRIAAYRATEWRWADMENGAGADDDDNPQ